MHHRPATRPLPRSPVPRLHSRRGRCTIAVHRTCCSPSRWSPAPGNAAPPVGARSRRRPRPPGAPTTAPRWSWARTAGRCARPAPADGQHGTRTAPTRSDPERGRPGRRFRRVVRGRLAGPSRPLRQATSSSALGRPGRARPAGAAGSRRRVEPTCPASSAARRRTPGSPAADRARRAAAPRAADQVLALVNRAACRGRVRRAHRRRRAGRDCAGAQRGHARPRLLRARRPRRPRPVRPGRGGRPGDADPAASWGWLDDPTDRAALLDCAVMGVGTPTATAAPGGPPPRLTRARTAAPGSRRDRARAASGPLVGTPASIALRRSLAGVGPAQLRRRLDEASCPGPPHVQVTARSGRCRGAKSVERSRSRPGADPAVRLGPAGRPSPDGDSATAVDSTRAVGARPPPRDTRGLRQPTTPATRR